MDLSRIEPAFRQPPPRNGREPKEIQMLKIKTLASGAAAAALVSVLGLSYAQVGAGATDNSDAKPMEQAPTPMAADNGSTNSSSPSTDSSTITERSPQADRN
jgi:hypothetical protein